MDDDDNEEVTLEQGRKQLQLLSKQFQEQKAGDQSVGSSNRQNLQAERKLLDQKPRGDRLKNRKGSPLGLTLEELDDRGLLDGGGVVPSYYTSLKQKQRRSLELQRRSSRMKLRGQDELKAYSLDSLVRMIKVFIRKGANFEEIFQTVDMEGRGIIEKDHFVAIIKEFGLPFHSKDIFSFAQRYSISDEHMDYEAFLQEIINNNEPFADGDDSFEGRHSDCDVSSFGSVMRDLYRMLRDSKNRLEKSVNDVYRMFSRWDHSGKRTVTSTQFFRVLSQLHVTFSDQEQDFIVELLDTNNEGKINFDALLGYCFDASSDEDTALMSGGGSHQHVEGGDESIVSIEGGSIVAASVTDVRSVSSGNPAKRPHTAAAFRSNLHGNEHEKHLHQDDVDSHSNSHGISSPIGAPGFFDRGGSSPQKLESRRPLTASARVIHNGYERNAKNLDSHITTGWQRDEDNNYILDISSGSDNEDNEPLHGHMVTGHDEHILEKKSSRGNRHASFSPVNNGYPFHAHDGKVPRKIPVEDDKFYLHSALKNLRSAVVARHNEEGLSLREVFSLFDKRCIRYIDAGDLLKTSFELKVDMSYEISRAIVRQVALDGVDRISFSEFAVWLTDPSHRNLEKNVQIQIADQLEQQGREYQYLIYRVFSQGSVGHSNHSKQAGETINSPPTCGLVSVEAFVEALNAIGLKLNKVDMGRIIVRFDTHGSDQCSVSRFMRMIQNNTYWKNAIVNLAYHEEAVEEAQVVRQRMHSGNRRAISTQRFDDETLDMAEYLGIRILSEPHLLWIVNEAIKSPLPKDWAIHQDAEGRTFFFNASTQVTRWDHPSDPELRRLRDYHRKRHIDQSEAIPSVVEVVEEYSETSRYQNLSKVKYDESCVGERKESHLHHSDISAKPRNFTAAGHNGTCDDISPSTNDYSVHHRNPKMNTILLYNNKKATGSKGSSKNVAGKTVSSYLPPKTSAASERKRAVSAGRLRKKTGESDLLYHERNKALDHMFGDHVIEELDLAMKGENNGHRNRQQRIAQRRRSDEKKLLPPSSNLASQDYKQSPWEHAVQRRYVRDNVWL